VSHYSARLGWVGLLAFMCAIRASSQPGTFPGNQPSPTPTPLPPSPVIIEKAAPDAPLPDLGTVPTERPEARTVPQKIARKAKDFAPKCLDAILHTCWAQPSAEGRVARTPGEAKYVKHMNVADFNLKSRNYFGAELRYREALVEKAKDPEANYKLALALDRQGKKDQARCQYQAFLALGSNAPFRSDASKALERLGGGLAAGTGCAEATAQEQRPNL